MAEVMTKKGHEVFINLEALEEIKNNLFELPEKQRSLLTIKDAVAYLLPSILNAKDKNYSEPEILELFMQTGVNFNKSSASYFWRIFKSMTQGTKHRKNTKDDKKLYIENDENLADVLKDVDVPMNTDVLENAIKNASLDGSKVPVSKVYEELRKSLPIADKNDENNVSNENEMTHSSAYFEVKPDTEDL